MIEASTLIHCILQYRLEIKYLLNLFSFIGTCQGLVWCLVWRTVSIISCSGQVVLILAMFPTFLWSLDYIIFPCFERYFYKLFPTILTPFTLCVSAITQSNHVRSWVSESRKWSPMPNNAPIQLLNVIS